MEKTTVLESAEIVWAEIASEGQMWFWYGLTAAILGAVSVVINKQNLKSVNASVVTWTLFTMSHRRG